MLRPLVCLQMMNSSHTHAHTLLLLRWPQRSPLDLLRVTVPGDPPPPAWLSLFNIRLRLSGSLILSNGTG